MLTSIGYETPAGTIAIRSEDGRVCFVTCCDRDYRRLQDHIALQEAILTRECKKEEEDDEGKT